MAVNYSALVGWIDDPLAVTQALPRIAVAQGTPPEYGVLCAALDEAPDDDRDVVFWRAEERVHGRMRPSWDQRAVGTCVSFGWARAINDLVTMMVAAAMIEPPGADIATEPIYALSRVEVGGGRIRGDGSIGAWAAEACLKYGNLLRRKYGSYDLSQYSEDLSRRWGRSGLPDDLEPTAKLHVVGSAVLVTNFAEAWKLLGAGHPIPVCSGVGFDSPLVEGFCEPRGSWSHCMYGRGRVIARRGTSRALTKAVPVQNSWGDYLRNRGEAYYVDRDGNRQPLPQGCFLADEEAFSAILRARDSFAVADPRGFTPAKSLDWLI